MTRKIARRIFGAFLITILVLLVLNIWSYLNIRESSSLEPGLFFKKTNFNTEKNIPSIFSGSLHFIASILLGFIGASALTIKNRKVFWYCLSFLFLFVGLDEILRIHEKLNGYLSSLWETSGIFHYAWVIPYGIAVILIALACFKPLFELPKRTLLNFILSALIFLLGAVGMEMYTGWYIAHENLEGLDIDRMPTIFVLYTIEELLEMLGVGYFIYSLLQFISDYRTKK